ncbi:MAG: regulatory protein RecX [Firmicutes bacterium]|nr:regulatory protein RecX [Bacillota bacterium]
MEKSGSEKEFGKALEAAWRLISYRPRSRRELADRLARKGFEPDLVEEVLAHLAGLGEVDDLAFSRLWVKSREATKPMGRFRLQCELREKEVSPQIIEEALAEYTPDKELELAKTAAQRRWLILEKLENDPYKRMQKLKKWLERRGFSPEVIIRVAEDLRTEGTTSDS